MSKEMGKYAHMADRHWKTHLPVYYRYLKDSNRLEDALTLAQKKTEETIESMLSGRRKFLESTGAKGDYLKKAAIEERARMEIEEVVLPMFVLLPPEAGD